jgi:hypothetical protein
VDVFFSNCEYIAEKNLYGKLLSVGCEVIKSGKFCTNCELVSIKLILLISKIFGYISEGYNLFDTVLACAFIFENDKSKAKIPRISILNKLTKNF